MNIYFDSETGEIIHLVKEANEYWDRFESRQDPNTVGFIVNAESAAKQAENWDLVDHHGQTNEAGEGKYFVNTQNNQLTERQGWEPWEPLPKGVDAAEGVDAIMNPGRGRRPR